MGIISKLSAKKRSLKKGLSMLENPKSVKRNLEKKLKRTVGNKIDEKYDEAAERRANKKEQ